MSPNSSMSVDWEPVASILLIITTDLAKFLLRNCIQIVFGLQTTVIVIMNKSMQVVGTLGNLVVSFLLIFRQRTLSDIARFLITQNLFFLNIVVHFRSTLSWTIWWPLAVCYLEWFIWLHYNLWLFTRNDLLFLTIDSLVNCQLVLVML